MDLAKFRIFVEASSKPLKFDEQDPIEAMYNPNQLTIVKSANWRLLPAKERDVPAAQFTHGEPATLAVDLFFDTFQAKPGAQPQPDSDVRKYTNRIAALTTVERHGDFHRPPICKLAWGQPGDFFQGVLQNLNQRFTLFLANGTPVRALLSCTFREWRSDEEEATRQNKQSADVAKTYTLKRGDTLSSIAGEQYSDPALWRPIAEANHIDDVRHLSPGQVLAIPALQPRRGTRR